MVSAPLVASVRRQLQILTVEKTRLGRDGKRRRLPVRPNPESVPRWLPGRPVDGKEREAQAAVLEAAGRLGELETTIQSILTHFPDRTPVILGLIRKVKSDLSHLEMRIKSKRG
jgi:hypothetical protein